MKLIVAIKGNWDKVCEPLVTAAEDAVFFGIFGQERECATPLEALTRVMRRTDLEHWLDLEDRRLSFEVLREVDFALYAPKWARKTHSRLEDQDIRYELGVAWFGKE